MSGRRGKVAGDIRQPQAEVAAAAEAREEGRAVSNVLDSHRGMLS